MSLLQQKAPEFSLFSNKRERFDLADQIGNSNLVLLFFPAAFTGTCTTELNTVSNDLGSYSNAAVFGISTDTPFTLDEFSKVNNFQFPLLSDHNATVSGDYGCKYNNDFTPMGYDRIAKRAAFVIDKSGTVRYEEILDNAGKIPNLDKIKSVLAGLG